MLILDHDISKIAKEAWVNHPGLPQINPGQDEEYRAWEKSHTMVAEAAVKNALALIQDKATVDFHKWVETPEAKHSAAHGRYHGRLDTWKACSIAKDLEAEEATKTFLNTNGRQQKEIADLKKQVLPNCPTCASTEVELKSNADASVYVLCNNCGEDFQPARMHEKNIIHQMSNRLHRREEAVRHAIKLISHHITAVGGNNNGSLISAMDVLNKSILEGK